MFFVKWWLFVRPLREPMLTYKPLEVKRQASVKKNSVSNSQFHSRQCIFKTHFAIWRRLCWDISVAKLPTKIPTYHTMWLRTSRSWTSMLTHYMIHVVNRKACKYSIQYPGHSFCNKTEHHPFISDANLLRLYHCGEYYSIIIIDDNYHNTWMFIITRLR